MQELPRFVREIINERPAPGAGLHSWLFRLARYLHADLSENEVFDSLKHLTSDCGRRVPEREIWNAVRNSKKVAWEPPNKTMDFTILDEARKPGMEAKRANLWRAVNTDITEEELRMSSPVDPMTILPHTLLERLYPGDTLICLGEDLQRARTNHRKYIDEKLVHHDHPLLPGSTASYAALPFQFIVPSPMKALTGRTQDGRVSRRCLDNVGPRWYAVVEFDSGTRDLQASIIDLLKKAYPLVMVVWSGSKSLHAWFKVKDAEETDIMRFYDLANVMGADMATRTPSQLTRCPWGIRSNDNVQEVLYLDTSHAVAAEEDPF